MTLTAPAAIVPRNPTRLPEHRHARSRAAIPLDDRERDETARWRARAAAELLAIQDGLLGRGWRVRRRAAYLAGYIRGATATLDADLATRN